MVITADAIASATPLVPITVSNAPATISVEICLAAAYLSRYKIYVSPRTPMVFVKVPAIEATPIEILLFLILFLIKVYTYYVTIPINILGSNVIIGFINMKDVKLGAVIF